MIHEKVGLVDPAEYDYGPTIQEQHQQLVSTSFKNIDGRGGKMELLHAILGLAGEVGDEDLGSKVGEVGTDSILFLLSR